MTKHIIPDIHGRLDKLEAALKSLGFSCRAGAWRHPAGDEVVFLGDFIDRGPHNGAVIALVRDMIEAGTATAVLGNHELNAIHYHTDDPETGEGLRVRSKNNTNQHAAFLAEFPLGSPQADEAIRWMKTIPVILDAPEFRAVHACWDINSVSKLLTKSPAGVISDEVLFQSADERDPFMKAVERLTKGPELTLPDGVGIHDQEGVRRERVRVRWWRAGARSWHDIAMSVFNPDELPDDELPRGLAQAAYGCDEKPVFFGHYWLDGAPELQSDNALCLDYSAGLDGPLVTYRFEPGADKLTLDNLIVHPLR